MADKTRVTTGKVRLSFPKLFEPSAVNPDDKPKYSTMVLIPKSDTETMAKLHAAEDEVKATKASKWGGKVPHKLKLVIHDGDEDDLERYPERAGHWYFTASSPANYKPGVVDRNVQQILDQSEVYSGVFARVSVSAFAYDYNGTKGIGFGLNNVQVLGGGERLSGGGVSADEDFDALDDDDLL